MNRKQRGVATAIWPVEVYGLWTPKEVADFYGYQVSTIANWRKEGRIPTIRLKNGAYRYDMSEVRVALEEGDKNEQETT
jgi:predicted site-specific integrase-resolvase